LDTAADTPPTGVGTLLYVSRRDLSSIRGEGCSDS